MKSKVIFFVLSAACLFGAISGHSNIYVFLHTQAFVIVVIAPALLLAVRSSSCPVHWSKQRWDNLSLCR